LFYAGYFRQVIVGTHLSQVKLDRRDQFAGLGKSQFFSGKIKISDFLNLNWIF